MSINRVLMCPPTYFDVAYSINPWMQLDNPVDQGLAQKQWQSLYETLQRLGVAIEVIEPVPGLLDMTFSGDAGMVVGTRFLVSSFRHLERRDEARHYAAWMASQGYQVLRVPDDVVFEGLGDVIYHGNDVLLGSGPRSDPEAALAVQGHFPELEIRGRVRICDDRFFHLALAAAFLDADTILYYPQAFDTEGQELIRRTFLHPIAVTEQDATEYFVCNNIVVGRHVLLDNCSNDCKRRLAEREFTPIKLDMSEFKKSGGSLRCLILKL
jgi:N-dimethylarginine dimethylaminohydrolase